MAVGRGDEHDARTKARGVTASFSLNGLSLASGMGGSCSGGGAGGVLVGGGMTENLENSGNPPEPDDQPIDLYRENEELKVKISNKNNQTHKKFCNANDVRRTTTTNKTKKLLSICLNVEDKLWKRNWKKNRSPLEQGDPVPTFGMGKGPRQMAL